MQLVRLLFSEMFLRGCGVLCAGMVWVGSVFVVAVGFGRGRGGSLGDVGFGVCDGRGEMWYLRVLE